ncbi:MAG: site-specific integrase [Methylococcales bacterium]
MNQVMAVTSQNLSIDGYLGELVLPGIDWSYFIERRLPTMQQEPELPAYLLLPEVEQLLSVTINQTQHFLLNTLFHTGARISEALTLTRKDFHLDGRYPEISVQTAKQKRGRPKANNRPKRRVIPVLDGEYIDETLRFFASNKGGLNSPLFTIDRSTVYRWIKSSVKRMEGQGMSVSIEVSPHTLRHSFAVNAILHWVPVPILQQFI